MPGRPADNQKRLDDVAASKRRHISRLNAVTIPPIADQARRRRCGKSLKRFCLTYGRAAFPLPFSADHLVALGKLQTAITQDGRFALAMPRGSGKTTMTIWALLWAIAYGLRRYIVIIAADMDAAKGILDAVKAQIETNPLLFADFPELAAPARAIDGVAQRASRLHVGGTSLEMVWTSRRIVCGTVEGVPSSGVRVEAYGLEGRLRGAFHQHDDGRIDRPDLALLDDPQSDQDARSSTEVGKREKLIQSAVMGLAGPGRKIAAVMPCTVICPDDLADRLLTASRNPDWQALRAKLVYDWPEEQASLWAEYAEIRREAQLGGDPAARPATAYYRRHRRDMDRGSRVGWRARKYQGELSALQHAENLLLDHGEEAFASEYQNQPLAAHAGMYILGEREVLSQLNHLPPRTCPPRTSYVVAFIDLNRYGLHWLVAATRMDHAMAVLDYGKWPPGSEKLYRGDGTDQGTEAQVFRRGLDTLGEQLVNGRKYTLADQPGRSRRIDLIMVDSGYLDTAVFDFAGNHKLPVRVLPSKGFGARNYRPSGKHGKVGDRWHETAYLGKGQALAYDADLWRMRSQKAWLQPVGSSGSMALFGDNPVMHRELAAQATRERLLGIEPTGTYDRYIWQGETTGQWHDLGDCITGVFLAAGYLGASVLSPGFMRPTRQRQPKRVSKIKPE